MVGVGQNAVHASVHGSRMVYVQSTTSSMDIWRLPLSGTSRATQTPEKFLVSSGNAAYSPDGQRIAFESSAGAPRTSGSVMPTAHVPFS